MMSQPGEEWSNLSDGKQDLLFLMRTNSNPDTKNNSDTGLVPKASAKRREGGLPHSPEDLQALNAWAPLPRRSH